jgi:hypothetical protein
MRKIWFVLLVGILGLTVAGCGGGSRSSTNEPTLEYSLDYFGMETGFQSEYSAIEIKNGITSYHTYTKLVTGEMEPGSGIYKVAGAYEDETLGDKGDYIQKKGNRYYQYGDWNGAEVYWEPEPRLLLLENPVKELFYSPYWEETVIGKDTVNVTAGTFTAWVFQKEYDDLSRDWGNCTIVCREWFEPYLGFVKSEITITRKGDGVTFYNLTLKLKSSATGIRKGIYNNIRKDSQVVQKSTTKGNIRCGLADFGR